MRKSTAIKGFVAGCLLLVGGTRAAAAPTVEQMLTFKPGQPDIQVSTPAPDEYKHCEVKLVTGTKQGASGWLLIDGKKNSVRRFFDSNGDKKIDQWSYFKDGQEVYREIDTNYNERADQYRWLSTGGMKWGVSSREDGKIDTWRMISAEEIGQEIFAAMATRDFERLQPLFISEAEMRALKLPAAQAQKLVALQKNASSKFTATLAKLTALDAKARFLRMESATPSCIPADSFGGEADLIKVSARAILFETADKKHDWVQSGDMIQVGLSWRLLDAPSPQDMVEPNQGQNDNPQLRQLLEALSKIDKDAPPPLTAPGVNKVLQDYSIKRVDVIEKILPLVKGDEQENWIRQICDSLSQASQAGHDASLTRLGMLRDSLAKKMPSSNLAGYAAYRELWAAFAPKLVDPKQNQAKVQEEWHEKLAKFAQEYPTAEDTPDALNNLAMDSEAAGKDEAAKRYYEQIYTRFATHFLAERAKGAVRRLGLVGQPIELAGPELGSGATFNITALKGKAVVVYFWASHVGLCERDFDTLKRIRATDAKDVELVCVSLDDNADAASKFLQKAQVSGVHLFQASKDGGGLSSPLAVQYGISGLPHLFLVGRDGRVISQTLRVADLENELKKAL